jgi:tRNA(fMet)-specific endonuclease VapC
MASGSRLLDSSVLVALFREDPTVRDRLAREPDLFIAATSVGEVLFGAMRSAKPLENEDRASRFAAGCTVLPTDEDIGGASEVVLALGRSSPSLLTVELAGLATVRL